MEALAGTPEASDRADDCESDFVEESVLELKLRFNCSKYYALRIAISAPYTSLLFTRVRTPSRTIRAPRLSCIT